jgi:hypothetical protein
LHIAVRMAPTINKQLPLDRVSTLGLLVAWIQSIYRRLTCAVMGHQTVLHFEPRRLALRCIDCGHETPGWMIGDLITREVRPDTRGRLSVDDRAA